MFRDRTVHTSHPTADRHPNREPARSVLYVEDNTVNVLLMEALFAKLPGVRLIVALTGEQGLHAAMDHTPDLMLLDLRLPDCHGTQLLERMRTVPALSSVPAVAVTAETTVNLNDTTFLEVWPKPLDIRQTLSRLECLLAATPEPARSDPCHQRS